MKNLIPRGPCPFFTHALCQKFLQIVKAPPQSDGMAPDFRYTAFHPSSPMGGTFSQEQDFPQGIAQIRYNFSTMLNDVNNFTIP